MTPRLKQREFRRALSQSIHRSEIIRYKLNGMAEETASILPKVHPSFNAGIHNPEYDPAAAKHTIESLRLRAGSIHLTLKCSNNPGAMDDSKVIAYQLSQAGLNVEMQSFEWGKFYNDVKKGNFQLAAMSWVGISDADGLTAWLSIARKKPPGGRNRGSYPIPWSIL